MSGNFTWMPLYKEIAHLLLEWEERQQELLQMLRELSDEGVKVTPFRDRDISGNRHPCTEIDPFTFFGTFNRGIRDSERILILKKLKDMFGAKSPVPVDFDGIPILNNQQSWFVGYEDKRHPNDVPTLWNMFRMALEDNPLENPAFSTLFDQTLAVRCVAINLTMGLFWIRPETFIALDSRNRQYLDITLPRGGLTAKFYLQQLENIKNSGQSIVDISRSAYLATMDESQTKKQPKELPTENNYWLVGAYWDDQDPQDQTQRFKDEGVWRNGFEDELLDVVNSMGVGDRIAIKAVSTQKKGLPFDARGNTVSRMTIKAVGTIVGNPQDGHEVQVEWDPDVKEKNWYFYTYRSTIWKLKTEQNYKRLMHVKNLIDFVWNEKPQDYDWYCKRWFDKEASLESTQADAADDKSEDEIELSAAEPYGVEDIVDANVFLSQEELESNLDRLKVKKNLIIQGPPGVGKTFLARKLAYALMEEKDPERVEFVQFHQTYSYEDFVRGYRPLPDQAGSFGLQDSVFYEFCMRAKADIDRDYVFLIDEINRGNLSQIFGELLMLLEHDKRGPEFAVPLVYRRPNEERFFIPSNVYIIGLMNLADRSLAIVDYALRRRFAFMSLRPQYQSQQYSDWLINRQMDPELAQLIIDRMSALNQQIADDSLLGENYQVGHSFFCPRGDDFSGLDRRWYDTIVRMEIGPLLHEYWFDNTSKAEDAYEKLLTK